MTGQSGYLPLSGDRDGMAPATHTPMIPRNSKWRLATSSSSWMTQAKGFAINNAGLLLVTFAQFFFATMNLSVKLLRTWDPPIPTTEVITIRMGITVCFCMIYMTAKRIPDPILGPKGVRGLLIARGLVGFIGIFGEYYALSYLPLADTTVITFLTPFAVALVGHLLLGENYTRKEGLAGVCGLLGVVLIARPPFLFGSTVEGDDGVTSFQRFLAIGSTLLSVFGQTMTYIVMRMIGPRAHPVQVMTFFSFWCVIMGSFGMTTVHKTLVFAMPWQRIVLLLILGLLSVAGQFLLTIGLHYDTATRCSLSSYTQIFFAVVLEVVVLGTVPSLLTTAGTMIIIAAQVAAVLSKENPSTRSPAISSPPSSNEVEERPFLSRNSDDIQDEDCSPVNAQGV